MFFTLSVTKKLDFFYSCKFAKVLREFDDLKAKIFKSFTYSPQYQWRSEGTWRTETKFGARGKTWRPGTKVAAVKKLDDLFWRIIHIFETCYINFWCFARFGAPGVHMALGDNCLPCSPRLRHSTV